MIAAANPSNPLPSNQAQNDASIVIASGAVLDVSGDDTVVLPMSRNQVDVDIRSNELADSPFQRDGVVQGDSLSVDARVGSTLADVQTAIDNIERSVNERLSTGGTITLGSEGTVDVGRGAEIDISGGQVRFESGVIASSQLIAEDGTLVDVSDADPNLTYIGVFSGATKVHEAWGVTENFLDPTGTAETDVVEGYTEGKDAGILSVRTHGLNFEGSLRAAANAGVNQRLPTTLPAPALTDDTLGSELFRIDPTTARNFDRDYLEVPPWWDGFVKTESRGHNAYRCTHRCARF